MDSVGADALARFRILEVSKVLELVRSNVESVDIADVGILDPDFIVGWRACESEMAELSAISVPFLRRLPYLEPLCLLVKPGDRVLVHHTNPGIIVLVQ